MALVTISGFPCSGKSTLAQKLAEEFERLLAEPDYAGQKLRVVIVSDDTSHVPRNVYDGRSPSQTSTSSQLIHRQHR